MSKSASRTAAESKKKKEKGPCPHLCNLVPLSVPGPGRVQEVIHPKKDVFVLKVAKIGAKGERRTKVELELVTPQYHVKKLPYRVDTRETQCDSEPCPCSRPRK